MSNNSTAPGLLRRLVAIFYDLLLLLGILFVFSAIAVGLNGGQAVTHPAYYLALVIISFLFFGWFWTHGGQTLGMRTWRFELTDIQGNAIGWRQAAIRFAAAGFSLLPAGIGLLWIVFDSNNMALHDRLSSTRMVKKPK